MSSGFEKTARFETWKKHEESGWEGHDFSRATKPPIEGGFSRCG